MFFLQLIIGVVFIVITVVIHAVTLDYTMARLERIGPRLYKMFRRMWKVSILTFAVLAVFMAHIVQMWIWAIFYWAVSALPDFESALYFSTSTFTTVGFGDIVLSKEWRLLSSFQSANGFILFGWSTAFIFEVMSQLYQRETIKKMDRY